jgi:sigma-B regulation protein RsbU (phosphoserine phosphatase)
LIRKIVSKDRLSLRLLALLLAFSLIPLVTIGILSILEMNQASKDVENRISDLSTTLNRSALTVDSDEADQLQFAVAKADQYNDLFSRIMMETMIISSYASLDSNDNCSIPKGIWIAPVGSNSSSPGKRVSTIRALCIPARIMESISQSEPFVALSFMGTTDGVLITYPYNNETISRTIPFDYMDRHYYSVARSKGVSSWIGPYRDENGLLKITYVSPITRNKDFFGIAGMDISLEPIYKDLSSIGGRGYPFILNDSGRIILRPKRLPEGPMNGLFASDNLAEINDSEIRYLLQKIAEDSAGTAIFSLGNRDAYVAFAPISSMGWNLGMIYLVEEMSLPARFIDKGIKAVASSVIADLEDAAAATKELFGLIIILTICAVLVASSIIGRRLRSQIDSLTEAADEISHGEFDVHVDSSGEMVQLAHAITNMGLSLKSQFSKIENDADRRRGSKREREILDKLKSSLIPDYLPKPDGYDIAALHSASETSACDIYDVLEVRDKVALFMSSVGGEGIQTAIMAILSRALIRASSKNADDPSRVMIDLNSGVAEQGQGMQLTCFYALLDPANHTLEYANAGFNPPFIVDMGGTIDTLGAPGGGISLGMLEQIDLKSIRIPLQQGDVLVIYSNGLTESVNGQKQYGVNRLISIVKDNRELTPAKILGMVESDLKTFLGNLSNQKDVTLLILKRKLS